MPKVPEYQPRVAPQQMPGVRQDASVATPDAFGAGVGRALQGAGQTVESLGNQGMNVMFEVQKRKDNIAAQDALLKIQSDAAVAADDPNTGWRRQAGVNAVGTIDKATKSYEDAYRKNTANLTPDQVSILTPHIEANRTTYLGSARDHEYGQLTKAESDNCLTLAGQAADSAAVQENDARAGEILKSGYASLQRFASINGLTPEQFTEKKLEMQGLYAAQKVDRLVMANRITAAADFINNGTRDIGGTGTGIELDPKIRTGLLAKIKPLDDEQQAQTIAVKAFREIQGSPEKLVDMTIKLMEQHPGMIGSKAASQLKGLMIDQESGKDLAAAKATRGMGDFIARYRRLPNVLEASWMNLPASTIESLQVRADAEERQQANELKKLKTQQEKDDFKRQEFTDQIKMAPKLFDEALKFDPKGMTRDQWQSEATRIYMKAALLPEGIRGSIMGAVNDRIQQFTEPSKVKKTAMTETREALKKEAMTWIDSAIDPWGRNSYDYSDTEKAARVDTLIGYIDELAKDEKKTPAEITETFYRNPTVKMFRDGTFLKKYSDGLFQFEKTQTLGDALRSSQPAKNNDMQAVTGARIGR